MQGARDTDVTSVEYSKENKRGHTDRGETLLRVYGSAELLYLDVFILEIMFKW